MKGVDELLSTDHYVADLIATLGTADIVLGSVDKTGIVAVNEAMLTYTF